MMSSRQVERLIGWLAIPIAAGAISCGDFQARRQPPNVVLILIDALRADHLGCYGYERPTSPVIDALAAEGVLFEQATSSASWTKPSIPTLFTGLYPIQHRVFTGNKRDTADRITSDVLSQEHLTVAEALKDAGYATGAFVHNAQISSFMGFDQGFDVYEEGLGDAVEITERALEWLRARSPDRPFFAYVHYLDPHWPYDPPAPFGSLFPVPAGSGIDFNHANWKRLKQQLRAGDLELTAADAEAMRALYDAEIRYNDAALGQLFATLRSMGALDDTIIVLTADHGEEFLEHGSIGHGHSLYDEVLRVPLIIKAPGIEPRRLPAQVELVDVTPTILSLAGIDSPGEAAGRSLAGGMRKGRLDPIHAFADHRPGGDHGRLLQSVRGGGYKLIRTYELPGSKPAARRDRRPRLERGMWLEVEGVLTADGRFRAVEIEPMEPRAEIGLVGPITGFDRQRGTFSVLGRPCALTAGTRVRDQAKRPLDPVALGDGIWIKAKGTLAGDGTLQLNKATRIDRDADREPEIKAPISAVGAGEHGPERLTMGGLRVIIDEETTFEGPWPALAQEEAAAAAAAGAPGLAATRLSPAAVRAGRSLARIELYDLERDPAERHDVAEQHPDLVRSLMSRLDDWEAAHERLDLADGELTLDAETIRALRALGYVQ